ncbi:peptidoglycan DD-metalloendopeptidase family protein [Jannaschia sp. LMIT008]|uniref:peptidoglycan DD-metalloendopeptidase family protein n=1 Tax=Jannaschia maritima TaxID=3032585 RepID=UPI0028124CE0|nr:peptidoglycan DD-metalloendopeptidase family protein [Jannaschia sp. LMIT008]
MAVDPAFRDSRARARARIRRRRAVRWGPVAVVLLGGGGLAGWWWDAPGRAVAWWNADDRQLTQVAGGDVAIAPVVAPGAFLDIPGDPNIVALPEARAGGEGDLSLPGPAVLDVRRFGLPSPDRFRVLRDDLLSAADRLMTVLPSSREDLAYLQDQIALAQDGLQDLAATEDGATGGSSLAFIRAEDARVPVWRDTVLRATAEAPLDVLLADADAAVTVPPDLIDPLLPGGTLPGGSVLALRGVGADPTAAQASLYLPGAGYRGTRARDDTGAVADGVDPWVEAALTAEPDEGMDGVGFRLADALYSAMLRAGLEAEVAGGFVSVVAGGIDLDRTALRGDRLTLAFSRAAGPGGTQAGRLAYAAVSGPGGDWRCYVVPDGPDGFRCHVPGRAGAVAVLAVPVEGRLSSRYGMRRHPIHGDMRLHAGVDWAAPAGTPVRAAAAGIVAGAAVAGGYGNMVTLAHSDGLETRYAHLSAFADGLSPGDAVERGEVVGYVGTTGTSTGNHLHFEVRSGGRPTDPMALLPGGGLGASDAVEALVARIIQVESAGRADARNPRSTATGLGQFIESTWLRMMRTYRPDLVATNDRAALLALRTDPGISRRMVARLAAENEAYLRARGHEVTSGRLYLAHFLGPQGADIALRADPDADVGAVMGAAVVRANPFLRGWSISDLTAWAARKMRGPGAPAAPAPAPVDPAVAVYVELIDGMVGETG